jgi:outer membrane protein
MKNKFILAAGLLFGLAALPATAQVKIGFIYQEKIYSQMPEAKQVEEDLKNTEKQYQTLIQGKIKDFQDKAAVYEKLPANTSDIIKQDKEKELQNLQTSIQEFQQNAQTSIQRLQQQRQQLSQQLLRSNSYRFYKET